MLNRISKFNKQDWKHISLLLYNSIVQLFKGNFSESKEAIYWIKIHISYDSQRVK